MVCTRISRAKPGEKTAPTAIMLLVRPMPSAPVTAMASTMLGKESSASMIRPVSLSTQPPR
ncbi:MAG: hypothetical protein JWP20_2907 [Roseomonas sp.]|nr:hypothetical protein [Roseomonas sp.]